MPPVRKELEGPEIVGMARSDLGMDMPLNLHPGFDMNPFAPAPDESTIRDDKTRGVYRRIYDQCLYSRGTIEGIDNGYRDAIEKQRTLVFPSIEKPAAKH